jgi:hypothetical protein
LKVQLFQYCFQSTLYISPRLSRVGVNDYPNLLRDAVSTHNAEWLSLELSKNNRLNTQEQQTRQSDNKGSSN